MVVPEEEADLVVVADLELEVALEAAKVVVLVEGLVPEVELGVAAAWVVEVVEVLEAVVAPVGDTEIGALGSALDNACMSDDIENIFI